MNEKEESLQCVIVTTTGIKYEGPAYKISVETDLGEILFLPNHFPLTSILRAGIVKIYPIDHEPTISNYIPFSVTKGLIAVEKNLVRIITSQASDRFVDNENTLRTLQTDLEKQIESLQTSGSLEAMEKALISLDKIKADIRLLQLQEIKE